MGKCEKCPVNFGITAAENVVQGFKPETLKSENSDAVRISRDTAMARAAYEQVVQLVDCHYDPDPQPDVDESEEVLSDEAGADEHSDADVQVQTPEGAAVFRMLMGDNDKQQHRACLEHFQIALNMLMINTPTGPQTVFPDGTKLPPHTQQSDGNGTGQYL